MGTRIKLWQRVGFVAFLFLSVYFNQAWSQNGEMVGDQDFSVLLNQHVAEGQVDYRALQNDPRIKEYLTYLSRTDPSQFLNDSDRLAYWINVYNAYTLKLVSDHYPIKSINDLHWGGLIIGTVFGKTAWDRPFVKAGGKVYTLNQVEHKIIRKEFNEPRIHFALVCAAQSCPPLRSEAYAGDSLNEQLDDQARKFLNDPLKNSFDPVTMNAKLSSILNWFKKDFGSNEEERLRFIARYLPDSVSESLRAHPEKWKVSYRTYDWSLNSQ